MIKFLKKFFKSKKRKELKEIINEKAIALICQIASYNPQCFISCSVFVDVIQQAHALRMLYKNLSEGNRL
jgi:hypothetical protein